MAFLPGPSLSKFREIAEELGLPLNYVRYDALHDVFVLRFAGGITRSVSNDATQRPGWEAIVRDFLADLLREFGHAGE